MLRRALLWLLPAVLALTFALPAQRAAAEYGATIEPRAESCASLAGISFLPSDRPTGFSPWSDLDDDDRVVHAGAVTTWAPVTFSVPLGATSDVPRGTYSISAAFPRGPPSA